jgi:hypothetical protein
MKTETPSGVIETPFEVSLDNVTLTEEIIAEIPTE